MVKCYIALAESEDGLKGKGKVFLDKDNCFNYIEHTEGYSTILVGEILEEVLPVHNLVARIKYRDGVSDELDEDTALNIMILAWQNHKRWNDE